MNYISELEMQFLWKALDSYSMKYFWVISNFTGNSGSMIRETDASVNGENSHYSRYSESVMQK